MRENNHTRPLGVFSAIAVGLVLATYIGLAILLLFSYRDGTLALFWHNLTGEGQSNVLAAFITLLGLLTSAVILPFVFNDRMSSFNEMVDKTEEDLQKLNNNVETKLSDLSGKIDNKIKDLDEQQKQRADSQNELMNSVYAAVISSLGKGLISDETHAEQIVDGLWQKVKFSTRERLNNKKYMKEATREQIRGLSDMSQDYLGALKTKEVISEQEKSQILQLRGFHYSHSKPRKEDFPKIVDLQAFVASYAGET